MEIFEKENELPPNKCKEILKVKEMIKIYLVTKVINEDQSNH
jgi:hypothetical protein